MTASASISVEKLKTANVKVAVVMPLAEQRGGGELMLLHLIQQGRNQGIQWTVIFLEDGPMVKQVQDWGEEAVVIASGRMREVARIVQTARRIAALVRQEKIDLIFSWMGTGQLYGGLAAWFSGRSAIWYQLGIPYDKGIIDRVATRLPARKILTCSQAGEKAQAGISPRRSYAVVYPGAELERFDPDQLPTPAAARQRLKLSTTGPLIGMVGRLQRWKGMHILVEAMPKVLEQYPDAQAVIVGGQHAFEPEYEALLKGLVAERGLAKNIFLAGLQSNVQDWMQAMDIFVHASENEPFGIVVIEAMALGKPVIATNTAGPTEIITPGSNGLLTTYGNAPELSQAILQYLGDPDLMVRMGEAAQVRAQDFSTQRYANELIKQCKDVISSQ